MAAKDCDLPPQCFRITLKDACSISIDPTGLSSRNKLFFLTNLCSTMVVKNIQIYVVQISGKRIYKSKN